MNERSETNVASHELLQKSQCSANMYGAPDQCTLILPRKARQTKMDVKRENGKDKQQAHRKRLGY